MRRFFSVFVGLLVVAAFSSQAFAERRRRQQKQKQAQTVPTSPQISGDMGDIEWGWSHKKLINHFTKQLGKMYRPVIAKAGDAVEEDRLRRELQNRVKRIKKSYVTFNGQHTGWDASLIANEFTHNNNEALVEVRELRAGRAAPRYTDYFFFINNALWKRYRAFNQDQFAGLSFNEAAQVFQKRYGKALPVVRTDAISQQKTLIGLRWQDSTTSLRAVDNTAFYGVLCLVYADRNIEKQLSTLRANKGPAKQDINPLVKALGKKEQGDPHENIVEHITGKRFKTSQPQKGVSGTKSPSKSKSKSSSVFDDGPSKQQDTNAILDDLL